MWDLVLEHLPKAIAPTVKQARKHGPSEAWCEEGQGPARCQSVGGSGNISSSFLLEAGGSGPSPLEFYGPGSEASWHRGRHHLRARRGPLCSCRLLSGGEDSAQVLTAQVLQEALSELPAYIEVLSPAPVKY